MFGLALVLLAALFVAGLAWALPSRWHDGYPH